MGIDLVMPSYATKPPDLFRPSGYTVAMGDLVVSCIAGGMTLTATCAQPGFPSPWILRNWCRDNPQFAEDVQIAQYVRASGLIDEAQAIADDGSQDYKTVARRDGTTEEVLDHEHVQRSKLRVDFRKWAASKLHREAWGESKQIDIDAKVLTVTLTDDELDKRLAQATNKLTAIGLNPLIIIDKDPGS